MNRSWIFLKIIIVILVIGFAGKSLASDGEDHSWFYLTRFNNKSKYEYNVSYACTIASYVEDINWQETLRLLAYDPTIKSDSIGHKDILLKDKTGSGCVVKIEPTEKYKDKAQTIYIKTGGKASGTCKNNFSDGPYDILVSRVFFDLKDASPAYIRTCGFQDAQFAIEIYDDGIKLAPWSNCEVLDNQKYVLNFKAPVNAAEEEQDIIEEESEETDMCDNGDE